MTWIKQENDWNKLADALAIAMSDQHENIGRVERKVFELAFDLAHGKAEDARLNRKVYSR